MKNQKLTSFLKNKRIFVISPHFDDAILSAGMLMYLLKAEKNVTVVNLFTKAHNGPYTISGKKFLNEAGFKNAVSLFADRKKTDEKALAMVGVKHINLNLTDALFRRKKKTFTGRFIAEFDHVYPTYNFHLLKGISKKDKVVSLLQKKLTKIIPKSAIVIAPYGIGSHADHVIARKVSEQLFENLFYYIDFPYNVRVSDSGKKPNGYESIGLSIDKKIKDALISAYTSQVNQLFENGKIPAHKERFYVKKGIL